MEYCEGGSLDAIYRRIKERKGRTGEKVLGKVAEAVRVCFLFPTQAQLANTYLFAGSAWTGLLA
jgi:hypothetical protein